MDEIIQEVIKALFTLLATAIGGVTIALLNKLRKKYGLQADAEQDAKVRAAVQNAILATEERVRAEAIRRLQPTSNVIEAKMASTVTQVLDAVPGVSHEEATRLVNEELPKVRAATATFMGQVGQAAVPLPASKKPLR